MGKIKKIIENELVGGTQTTDIYPVTSVKAVYDENNERLDNILNRRGVVNISTNYNADHIAEVLTLEQAIAKVPSKDRVLGFQGKFLSENGWKSYVFIGDSIADWTNKTKWNNYLTGTDIVQESGEAEDKVMSQKAVSDKLSDLSKNTSTKFYVSMKNGGSTNVTFDDYKGTVVFSPIVTMRRFNGEKDKEVDIHEKLVAAGCTYNEETRLCTAVFGKNADNLNLTIYYLNGAYGVTRMGYYEVPNGAEIVLHIAKNLDGFYFYGGAAPIWKMVYNNWKFLQNNCYIENVWLSTSDPKNDIVTFKTKTNHTYRFYIKANEGFIGDNNFKIFLSGNPYEYVTITDDDVINGKTFELTSSNDTGTRIYPKGNVAKFGVRVYVKVIDITNKSSLLEDIASKSISDAPKEFGLNMLEKIVWKLKYIPDGETIKIIDWDKDSKIFLYLKSMNPINKEGSIKIGFGSNHFKTFTYEELNRGVTFQFILTTKSNRIYITSSSDDNLDDTYINIYLCNQGNLDSNQDTDTQKSDLFISRLVGKELDVNGVLSTVSKRCFSTNDRLVLPYYGIKLSIECANGYSVKIMTTKYTRLTDNTVNDSGWLKNKQVYVVPQGMILYRISIKSDDYDITEELANQLVNGGFIRIKYEDKPSSVLQRNPECMKYMRAMCIREEGNLTYPWGIAIICHTTDVHGDATRYKNFIEFANDVKADIVLNTGDNSNYEVADGQDFIHNINSESKVPILNVVGNHDTNGNKTNTERYQLVLAKEAAQFGYNLSEDKTYYYYDLTDKKLRFIILNNYEEKNVYWIYSRMSQTQMDWLVATLNSTPLGYGVIIAMHAPDSNIIQNNGKFLQKTTTKNNANIEGSPISMLIDNFISRSNGSYTYTQTSKSSVNSSDSITETVTVNYDFRNVDISVEFIALITGHNHSDNIGYVENVTNKILLINETCTVALYEQLDSDNKGGGCSDSDLPRFGNDSTQDSFNVYAIDKNSKTIAVSRIGSNITINNKVRDYQKYKYTNTGFGLEGNATVASEAINGMTVFDSFKVIKGHKYLISVKVDDNNLSILHVGLGSNGFKLLSDSALEGTSIIINASVSVDNSRIYISYKNGKKGDNIYASIIDLTDINSFGDIHKVRIY